MIFRRSFLSSLGVAFALKPPTLSAQSGTPSSATGPFQPARHGEDDWLDKVPGKHRLVFDTTAPDGFGASLLYSSNFLDTNKNAYGLEYSDVALVIVVRHNSTAFAYNDAMWSKYGKVFATRMGLSNPESRQTNPYLTNAAGMASNGMTLESVLKRGAQLAVCRLATRNLANQAANATQGQADKINEELIANIVTNAHMVPAGIVALSRAQERGYTFAHGV